MLAATGAVNTKIQLYFPLETGSAKSIPIPATQFDDVLILSHCVVSFFFLKKKVVRVQVLVVRVHVDGCAGASVDGALRE